MMTVEPQMTFAITDWSGPWSILPTALSGLQAIEIRSGISGLGSRESSSRNRRPDSDGVLTIEIRSALTKNGSGLTGSSAELRDEITAATQDPTVRGVLVVIDSPGGSVAGGAELSGAVGALSARKPVTAFVEDTACGVSVWFASQARKFYANSPNAVIGGVGVSMGIYDRSKAAEKDGVTPVMIRTGELKGAGFPGSTVTDRQIAMWQRVLNSSFELMATDIRRARPGITPAQWESISKGGVFAAKQAIALGLVDGICSIDQALVELRSMISSPQRKEATTMVTTPVSSASTFTRPVPVPTASALESWESAITSAMLSGATRAEAIRHLAATQPALHRSYLAEYTAQHVQRRSAAAPVATPARDRWDAAISGLVEQGMSKEAATLEVIKSDPSLHREFLAEANQR